ncbi:hypothetical protein [Helicobacter pylori]|uniref:hypothetical protein n=1 Tax=Helicobacter pylori TaxID=210 RepID=UPI001A953165|nr:hypothetical protein [Helicobacter pylori]
MGRFVVSKKKKKKGFWGVLEPFFNIKGGLKSGLIGISGKNGDSFTWWDCFRFGCKT